MNKPVKPEVLVNKEAREMLINGVNYIIQETGIRFSALESIIKDIYEEVGRNAQAEFEAAAKQYEEELKAYEEETNTPAEERPVEPEVIG